MSMISKKRTFVIPLLIIVFLLVCYRTIPYFKTADTIENGTETTTIRINPLSIRDASFVKDTVRSRAPVDTPRKGDLTGLNLELDQAHALDVKMYSDREFSNEQYLFDASEKVFLVMEFTQLLAGEYDIMILWKNPEGKSVNTSTHNISLTQQPSKHRVYFWLKLIKNGVFSQLISGDEYKGEIHGRWVADIFFDGVRVATQPFMVSH